MSTSSFALAAILRPQVPPEGMVSAIEAAEQAGLGELWLWEDCFLEGGLTSAAVALARTERMVVGLGLMPVPLRNVALAAMEIATLDRLYPDRFRITLGHGMQFWMDQVNAKAASPVTLLREYALAMKALLRGETVSVQGEYVTLREVALEWPPLTVPKVLMGGRGPRSLALAGEVGDGIVFTPDYTPERMRAALDICLDARAAVGNTEPFEVIVFQRAFTGPDAQAQLLAEEPEALRGAGVAGDADMIAARVREMRDAGADTVCLCPPGVDTTADDYVRFVAHEVKPLI